MLCPLFVFSGTFRGLGADVVGASHEFLEQAFDRYRAIIFPPSMLAIALSGHAARTVILHCVVESADLTLGLETCENYTLTIEFPNATPVCRPLMGFYAAWKHRQMVQPDLSISRRFATGRAFHFVVSS